MSRSRRDSAIAQRWPNRRLLDPGVGPWVVEGCAATVSTWRDWFAATTARELLDRIGCGATDCSHHHHHVHRIEAEQ